MSKTSRALQRLGVGLLSAATISGGLVAFVAPSASAVVTGPVTTVKITPVNAALSTQSQDYNNDEHHSGNPNIGCQHFAVEALNADGVEVPDATINILLTPSAGVDSEFCDAPRSSTNGYFTGEDGTYPPPSGDFTIVSSEGVTDTNYQGAGNPGLPDQGSATGTGPAIFGVNECTDNAYQGGTTHCGEASAVSSVAGSIGITAYVDSDGNKTLNGSEPKASSTLDIVSSPNSVNNPGQNEIVDGLTVDQPAVNRTDSEYGVDYMLTAKHGANDLVAGADVRYEVRDAQGNLAAGYTDPAGYACGTTRNAWYSSVGAHDGTTTCWIDTPTTVPSPLSGSPFTVTFFVPKASCDGGATAFVNTASCKETSVTATITTEPPAPTNSIVTVSCGGASTMRWSPQDCVEPQSATTETIKATVLAPASATATSATVPTPNVVVWFPTDAPSLTPANCITGADGTCSVTLNRDNPASSSGDDYWYEARIWANPASPVMVRSYVVMDDNYGSVAFGEGYEAPATNIKAANATATAAQGQPTLITMDVSNQYDNASNLTCYDDNGTPSNDDCYNLSSGISSTTIPVTMTVTGGGTFTDGTTTKVVQVANGLAQATIISSAPGTDTVTGTLDPTLTDCSYPAGTNVDPVNGEDYNATDSYDPNARAGTCTATEAVTFSGPDTLSVSAGSGRVGHVENASATVKKADGTADAGVVVHFTVTGANSASGSAVTNSSGVASFAYTPRHAGSDTVSAYADAVGNPHDSTTVSIARAKQHPTITLSSKHGKVTVHVTSHPKAAGASVTYQVKRHGSFHAIGSGTIHSNGKAHRSFSEPVGKHRTFRVHVGGTSDVKAGTSKAKHIKVKE